ncbi:VOC family protein [Paenibacillus sp. MMO-177]|uniref:VOC family protein n=1 Tax=Paenibacillus sp. MMO-177 TaxID=3081289 RepID=UPI003018F37A
MKIRVGAVFIPVLNLIDSITWYSEFFCLQLIDNWGAGASLSFKEGEALIALIQVEEIQSLQFQVNKNQKNVYFHFETNNINETIDFLEKKGVEIISSYDYGLMKECFIQDPSGNQIAIYCEKKESPFYNHATGNISW